MKDNKMSKSIPIKVDEGYAYLTRLRFVKEGKAVYKATEEDLDYFSWFIEVANHMVNKLEYKLSSAFDSIEDLLVMFKYLDPDNKFGDIYVKDSEGSLVIKDKFIPMIKIISDIFVPTVQGVAVDVDSDEGFQHFIELNASDIIKLITLNALEQQYAPIREITDLVDTMGNLSLRVEKYSGIASGFSQVKELFNNYSSKYIEELIANSVPELKGYVLEATKLNLAEDSRDYLPNYITLIMYLNYEDLKAKKEFKPKEGE